jgi:TonB family protein
LLALSLIFISSRRIERGIKVAEYVVGPIVNMDIVPTTRQGGLPRPPDMPQVPIPTEDEFIPEDETIETTELNLLEGLPLFDGFSANPSLRGGMGPRPIREVIPEYPESEREKEGIVILNIRVNQRGRVDSVSIDTNTTSSSRLGRSAVEAAYKGLYDPPRASVWIKRPYHFDRKR